MERNDTNPQSGRIREIPSKSVERLEHFTYFDDSNTLDGSHAAPMLLLGDERNPLVRRQQTLVDRLSELSHSELDESIGKDGAEFVSHSIKTRMHLREGQNSLSYMRRRHKIIPNLFDRQYSPLVILKGVERAKQGEGTPFQAHIARHALGMESAELANLTRIGKARREFQAPMYDAMQQLVGHDVDFGKNSVYRKTFTGTDLTMDGHLKSQDRPKFMRLEYKRKLAELEDGSKIRERTSVIINTSDPRVFDQDMIHYFQEVFAQDGAAAVSRLAEFGKIATDLVELNIDPRFIVAENETIYEYSTKERDYQKNWHQQRAVRNASRNDADANQQADIVSSFPEGDQRGIILATNGERFTYTDDEIAAIRAKNIKLHG